MLMLTIHIYVGQMLFQFYEIVIKLINIGRNEYLYFKL